jgi:PD-(D/E)XK nuclease superfamily protein
VRRDTGTGAVLERMVLPALERGGYTYETQVKIGTRIGGGSHVVDLVAKKDDSTFLISVKWQQVSGTAEQKVPFEVICLEEAIRTGQYEKAYVVLGGDGWKLRTFYTAGTLNQYIKMSGKVDILTLESFIAKANMAKL